MLAPEYEGRSGPARRLWLLVGLTAILRRATARCSEARPAVHAFYYLWYGEPGTDGKYVHWDHAVLPDWRAPSTTTTPVRHDPPSYLHSPFYPALGPYSSRNATVLRTHFAWMRDFGIDVAVLSWTGRGDVVSDTQGVRTDDAFPAAIAAAEEVGVQVAVHLEPYEGRSPATVRADLQYLFDTYGADTFAAAAACGDEKKRPLVYVYDAYHNSAADWAEVLTPQGAATIRGTALDVVAIATVLERSELRGLAVTGGFDGVFTYFATDGFTWGSSARNWPEVSAFGRDHSKLVSLSAGPGYNDTRIRPWNAVATRPRGDGAYFRTALDAAVAADPDFISVTSFNEWGEGTQVEPALVPHTPDDRLRTHLDYGGESRRFRYLEALRASKAAWQHRRRRDDPAQEL